MSVKGQLLSARSSQKTTNCGAKNILSDYLPRLTAHGAIACSAQIGDAQSPVRHAPDVRSGSKLALQTPSLAVTRISLGRA